MASWRPAVDLEAAASAADEDELTWRSPGETSGPRKLQRVELEKWKMFENVGFKMSEFGSMGNASQTMTANRHMDQNDISCR